MRVSFATAFPKILGATVAGALVLLAGCNRKSSAVSGTIEVDEVHVASRSAGRVEKIFAWEGDTLKANTPIVQLEASELNNRRVRLQGVAFPRENLFHPAEIGRAH